jgi:hypothetical protein
VYDYLLSESYHLDGVQILPRRDNIRRAYRSLVDGPYSSDSEENLIQHYLCPSFVGSGIAAEIHQTFYQTARLVVTQHWDIWTTLNHGPFVRNPSGRPGDSIRRLKVHLSYKDYEGHWERSQEEQHETSLSKRMFDTQLENLKDISNIKRLQGFELCISIRCILATTADQYTEILVPFVYGLKEKGAIVTVTRPSHLQGGPVQYNYDVPRAQRDEKIRTNSAFVSL